MAAVAVLNSLNNLPEKVPAAAAAANHNACMMM